MDIELSRLRTAVAAAEHGSFRRAATALNLKQSALSRRIRQLEEQFGVALFERSSGGVRVTPAGASVVRAAQRLFEQVNGMVSAVRAAGRGEAGTMMVGFCTSVSANKWRAILAEYVRASPDVGFDVVQQPRAQLVNRLGAGDLDIALIAGEAKQHNVQSMPLWSERIVAALPAKHPLSSNDVIYWSDLKEEPFLLSRRDPGPDLRNIVVRKLAAPGSTPAIESWDISNESVLAMLEAGLHVSVYPESWVSLAYPGVRFREVRGASGPSHITFTACWEQHNRNPALARFLEFLRKTHHPTPVT